MELNEKKPQPTKSTLKLHTYKWICGDRGGQLNDNPVWPAMSVED